MVGLTKAERTTLSILRSAELVFAKQGYERTTLDAIGERAHVLGTAVVLYHFKSKKLLYHETLRFAFMPVSKAITSDIDQSLSLEEMVAKIGVDLTRDSVDRPYALKLFPERGRCRHARVTHNYRPYGTQGAAKPH